MAYESNGDFILCVANNGGQWMVEESFTGVIIIIIIIIKWNLDGQINCSRVCSCSS